MKLKKAGGSAFVIGSGIAGLFAARVLSLHFEKVVVVEKDKCAWDPMPRAGVPQGRQTHVLLPGGTAALERLFPGAASELVRCGSRPFDYGLSHFHLNGHWMPRVKTGLLSLAQTRPFLEHHLRRWLTSSAKIEFRYETSVDGLCFTGTGRKARFKAIQTRGNGRKETLAGDLVVDASGRGSHLPRWLLESGFGPVPNSSLRIDVGYTTAVLSVPKECLPDHPLLYIVGPPPCNKKVGALIQVEHGAVLAGFAGYHHDYPPVEFNALCDFAGCLSEPNIETVLRRSVPVLPLAQYRVPVSVRYHYDRLAHFPSGVIPMGDAVSCFDPVFAQGMSVAAIEAEVLENCLCEYDVSSDRLTRAYLRRLDKVLNTPWSLSCGEDLRYPETSGRRSVLFRSGSWYKARLLASTDPIVTTELYKVLSLSASRSTLFSPGTLVRALGFSSN